MKWINKNIACLGDIKDFDLLKEEFFEILHKDVIEYKSNQLSLQKPDDWDSQKYGREEWCSVGKPTDFPDNYKSDEELFNTPIDIIRGTYVEELILKYDMFKTRCAVLDQKNCYTWHFDNWPRIHFVIESNPKCFFIFGEQGKQHLRESKIYFTDTTDPAGHTAINASWFPRVHIFGNVRAFDGRVWSMTEERKQFNEREKIKDMRLLHS